MKCTSPLCYSYPIRRIRHIRPEYVSLGSDASTFLSSRKEAPQTCRRPSCSRNIGHSMYTSLIKLCQASTDSNCVYNLAFPLTALLTRISALFQSTVENKQSSTWSLVLVLIKLNWHGGLLSRNYHSIISFWVGRLQSSSNVLLTYCPNNNTSTHCTSLRLWSNLKQSFFFDSEEAIFHGFS